VIHFWEENPSPGRKHTVLDTRGVLFGNVEEVVRLSRALQDASRDQEGANCQVEDRIVGGLCRQWYYRKRNEFELVRFPDWAGSRRRSDLMRTTRGSGHQG